MLLAYLGTFCLVAVKMRCFYRNLLTFLMRNLVTLIIVTLLSVDGGTLIFIRSLNSFLTMVLHLHSAAFQRLSNNVPVALLHITGHRFIAAHVLIAGAALRLVRVGALSLVLGLSNCEVAQLTTFPAFLTAAFLPLVLVVSTL